MSDTKQDLVTTSQRQSCPAKVTDRFKKSHQGFRLIKLACDLHAEVADVVVVLYSESEIGFRGEAEMSADVSCYSNSSG